MNECHELTTPMELNVSSFLHAAEKIGAQFGERVELFCSCADSGRVHAQLQSYEVHFPMLKVTVVPKELLKTDASWAIAAHGELAYSLPLI